MKLREIAGNLVLIREELPIMVESIYDNGSCIEIVMDGEEWLIYPDRETACSDTREYWSDMAKHSPEEFECMMGTETLVAWALGQYAGPGYTKVICLEEWLDVVAEAPEEHLACYDGVEEEIMVSSAALEALGFDDPRSFKEVMSRLVGDELIEWDLLWRRGLSLGAIMDHFQPITLPSYRRN